MRKPLLFISTMIPPKEELHELGYITKLHGYKGELTAFIDTADMYTYEDIESVFLEVKGQLIPYFIELYEPKTNNTVKIRLEGVDNEALAKTLVKAKIFILKEEISQEDEERVQLRSIIGFSVIDETKGDIGRVDEILELSGNPQIQIEFQGKKILLPLQSDFITKVDQKKKVLFVSAPEGLIELYL